MTVRIVGSGLAGATAAYLLHQQGIAVEVIDAAAEWGGQLRTASAAGVLYEPTGAHIFHTSDEAVWSLVSSLVEWRPYRHVVRTKVFGRTLSWPPQLGELRELTQWPVIERELAQRPEVPTGRDFETWCVELMGRTIYSEFIESYTRKQWGCDPSELASSFAPRRIDLRDDGNPYLFTDAHQAWPVRGYRSLIDALLRDVPVITGRHVAASDWDELCRGATGVILTCALDEFFDGCLGSLAWRGVRLENHYLPGTDRLLPAGVVNTPSAEVAYTRMIETKWMSGQDCPGTVISYEYPGHPARHYPVDDAEGNNRMRQKQYEKLLAELPGPPRKAAGRLATYTYIDMDQAIRQGMNAARALLGQLVGV